MRALHQKHLREIKEKHQNKEISDIKFDKHKHKIDWKIEKIKHQIRHFEEEIRHLNDD